MLLKVSLSRTSFLVMVAAVILLGVASGARGQCVVSPTGETAVRVKNASSYLLTFSVDENNKVDIRAGQKSIDFAISPGEHELLVRASSGEVLTASRALTMVEGMVCTWTVTDPDSEAPESFPLYRNPLQLQAVIPLTIFN